MRSDKVVVQSQPRYDSRVLAFETTAYFLTVSKDCPVEALHLIVMVDAVEGHLVDVNRVFVLPVSLFRLTSGMNVVPLRTVSFFWPRSTFFASGFAYGGGG